MSAKCPKCRGPLIWSSRTPFDRRDARCADCRERFTRRVEWCECLSLIAVAFVVVHLALSLLLDWFNPFHLDEETRRRVTAVVFLATLATVCIVVLILTRKGRRLVPRRDGEPSPPWVREMAMKVRCPHCGERSRLGSDEMKPVSTRRSHPIRFRCAHCNHWSRLSWSRLAKAIPFFVFLTPFALLPFVHDTEMRVLAFIAPAMTVIALGMFIGPFLLASRRTPPDGCSQCAYDLRDAKSGNCPECGTERR